MAGVSEIYVFKRDNFLLRFLKSRKGEENIASAKDICDYLNENGYKTNMGNVNPIIRKIMYEYNAPICSRNAIGYYWAKNRAEIETSIAELESRRASLQEHIDHLKNFIIE